MARKKQLRATRAGTVINTTSKKQESDVVLALQRVETHLNGKFAARIALTHEKRWLLKDIVTELRRSYPHVRFHHHFDNTSIRPDGGMLCIRGSTENDLLYPILIAEVLAADALLNGDLAGALALVRKGLSSAEHKRFVARLTEARGNP